MRCAATSTTTIRRNRSDFASAVRLGRGRFSTSSKLPDQAIVLRVRPDPEPEHFISLEHADRAPAEVDANRIDRKRIVDFLEAERRVRGVLAPAGVGIPSILLDRAWERVESFAEPFVYARAQTIKTAGCGQPDSRPAPLGRASRARPGTIRKHASSAPRNPVPRSGIEQKRPDHLAAT